MFNGNIFFRYVNFPKSRTQQLIFLEYLGLSQCLKAIPAGVKSTCPRWHYRHSL